MDRRCAIAGVLDDFALLDEDQRRTVIVAMPRDDAAGGYGHPTEAQFAALELGHLLAEIDRTERRIGDADRLEIDRLAGVRHALIGRALARLSCDRKSGNDRNGGGCTKPSVTEARLGHCHLLCFAGARSSHSATAMMRRAYLLRKCRVALVSIAVRYLRSSLCRMRRLFTPP